jgi:hypothetical protein
MRPARRPSLQSTRSVLQPTSDIFPSRQGTTGRPLEDFVIFILDRYFGEEQSASAPPDQKSLWILDVWSVQCSVADLRSGPVFCQKIRTPNPTWGPVQVKLSNLEPDIGSVHNGFGSGLNRFGPERTAKNQNFSLFLGKLRYYYPLDLGHLSKITE